MGSRTIKSFQIGGIMKARITIELNSKGELEIWLNPEGREELIKALQALDAGDEHFHMGTPDSYFEVELSPRTYDPTCKIIEECKVLYRTDEWDRQYYPHVFGPESEESEDSN
jgi:hypothetical protein